MTYITLEFARKRVNEQQEAMKDLVGRRNELDDKRYKDVYDSIQAQFDYFTEKLKELEK